MIRSLPSLKVIVLFICLYYKLVSFRGLYKLRPRPDWSLLGVKFKISDEHPRPFYMSPPPRVPSFKLHDVWQQENLRWNHHINETVKKTNKRLHYLRACRVVQLPPGVGTNLANEFQRIQNRSLDIIGVPMDTLPALEQRRREAAKAEQERILAD